MNLNHRKHPCRHEEVIQARQKISFCRCWQSKKFPYCDRSHKHDNQARDDQVGPLVVSVEEGERL